jgi:hypothetical protein
VNDRSLPVQDRRIVATLNDEERHRHVEAERAQVERELPLANSRTGLDYS